MKSLFAFLIVAAFATAAQASVQQVRVLAVGIDSSSEQAEAKAVDYAKKRAVYLIARKLPIDDPSAQVAALKQQQFDEIVRGASVLRTRREKEVTYAEVNVTVIDTALKRALGLPEGPVRDVSEIPAKMRGVLVLPVLVKNSRPYVWEKENDLREPLRSEVLRQSHGAVLVPAGDYDDLRLVDYQNVLEVTAEELAPMFERYGADEIVIAIFTLGGGDNHEKPGILLRRLTPKTSRSEVVQVAMPAGATQKTEERVAEAAKSIATAVAQIASSTADEQQKRLDAAKKIPISFLYANPRELAQMQEKLRNNKEVLLLSTPSITTQDITATAYVEGDVEKLRENLAKQAIIVTVQGDRWQLSLR